MLAVAQRNCIHPIPIEVPSSREQGYCRAARLPRRQDRPEPPDERDAGGDGSGDLQVVVRGLRPRPGQDGRPPAGGMDPETASLFPERSESTGQSRGWIPAAGESPRSTIGLQEYACGNTHQKCGGYWSGIFSPHWRTAARTWRASASIRTAISVSFFTDKPVIAEDVIFCAHRGSSIGSIRNGFRGVHSRLTSGHLFRLRPVAAAS